MPVRLMVRECAPVETAYSETRQGTWPQEARDVANNHDVKGAEHHPCTTMPLDFFFQVFLGIRCAKELA